MLLVEVKRAKLTMRIVEKDGATPRAEETHDVPSSKVTKDLLTDLTRKLMTAQFGVRGLDRKLVVACLASDADLAGRLGVTFANNRFNGFIHDASSGLTFIDKHELVSLNDFTKPSSFFEFNERQIQPGDRGLIVSLGNHLQTFEEHTPSHCKGKELVRIGLGALSFSPHTDLDHDFSLFLRKDDKRTVKYHEIISKDGFKLCHLFHLIRDGQDPPKEPTFKELLQLIRDGNPTAVKSAEYFFYLLAHFLYSGLILLMLNKELVLTGNFLTKVVNAFGNPQRLREVFLGNLVLAHHVRHTFDHLRISLQTDIGALVVKSALENF